MSEVQGSTTQTEQTTSKPSETSSSSSLACELVNNIDIFLSISEFLQIKELSCFMQVSKQMQKNCQEYFRQRLQKLGQLSTAEFEAADTTNFWRIYAEIYNREVLFTNISQSPIDRQSVEELKVFRSRPQKRLSHVGIKKFSIGTKFTAFLTLDKTLFFSKTTEYFSTDDAKFSFQKRSNIVKFSTAPRNFIYLTEQGQIYIVFHDEKKSGAELSEILLEWTLSVPVLSFKASYAFAAFIVNENAQQRPQNSFYLSKLVQGQADITQANSSNSALQDDTKLNIIVYHVNDFQLEDINNPVQNNFRMKRVTDYPCEKVSSYAVGYHQLLLVSPEHKLFSVDLLNYANVGGVTPNQLPAVVFEPLAKRQISKVFSGFASFFAYEREEVPHISKWTTEQVMEFLGSFEEFQDYINIVKYEGITGADLNTVTKKFMIDRLGLIRDELQLKLQTEIIKYRKETHKPAVLYGWGKNDSGQLALSKCTNINAPMKIDIPALGSEDDIEVIKIGWKNSVLITKEKRIFITENRERKAEKKPQDKLEEQEEEEKNDSRGGNKKSKKRKQSAADEQTSKQDSQNQNKNSKKNSKVSQVPQTEEQALKTRWIEITDKFAELKDKRKYKIIEVSCAKDTVCVLGNCYNNKRLAQLTEDKNAQSDELEEEKKKLTPVMPILNRIKWDPALDQSEFTVVYKDRFLKDLEMDFETFDISDVKSYRVTHIKRLGVVVWDREKKFEDLSL